MILLARTLDGGGIYGEVFHYSMLAAFFGSAVLVFLYLWSKGRLDMDEEPKMQMLEEDDGIDEEGD
jgi:uncharacterized membrane protein